MSQNGWYQLEQGRGRGSGRRPGQQGQGTDQQQRQGQQPQRQPQQVQRQPSPQQTKPPQAQPQQTIQRLQEQAQQTPQPPVETVVQSAQKPVVRPVPLPVIPPSPPVVAVPLPDSAPVQVGTRDPYGDMPKHPHSLTVGDRGPVLRHDTQVHETLEQFTHEKIVERTVHVKGFGAFGYFQPYQSMASHTMLPFLQNPGQQTPVAVRFSLAVSNKGTPDTSRNVRGFSTKFYTDQGNFDLLCNHLPVFSVRDAIRFPESIKAFLPSPVNNLLDPDRFWDFVSRAPESLHFVTWLYSDVGTIKSLRKIRGYGVNTYVWRNSQGQRRYVKYHWIPLAGEEYITAGEAAKISAANPDYCGRDLYDTIAGGEPVEYELRVQLMDPADAGKLPYDPLDDTKTWCEEAYPLLPVGRMTLHRNPDNYMEQTEKLAFSPANLLPGAELSDDKMLQGRSTIYWDAQRYRLGSEFREIPINRQKTDFDPGDLVTSGLGQGLNGKEERVDLAKTDDFAQPGERYRSLSPEQQTHLVENIAGDLKGVNAESKAVVLNFFAKADGEMAARIGEQMQK